MCAGQKCQRLFRALPFQIAIRSLWSSTLPQNIRLLIAFICTQIPDSHLPFASGLSVLCNMGHHSHSNSKTHHYNYNHHYSVPTSYGQAATFTVSDLGRQGQFDVQSMQRSDSVFSNADSHDSALNDSCGASYMYRDSSQSSSSTDYTSGYSSLGGINPAVSYEPDIHYFPTPVDTYQLQPASNNGFPGGSYSTDWVTPRTEIASYSQPVDSAVSPMSPGLQQNG